MGSRVTVGEIAAINARQYSTKEQWSQIEYLDTGSVIKGVIQEVQMLDPTVDNVPSRCRRKVSNGSILYSMVRPNQEHYALLSDPPKNMLVSTGFSVIDADLSCVMPEFLYYVLTMPRVTTYFQALAEQCVSTYPTLSVSDLTSFEIDLPSMENQKAISAVLKGFDEKISLNNRLNDYLEELGQVLLGGYIDECSKLAPLGDIMSFGNGFAFNGSSYTGSGTYKVLTIKNVQDGKVDCSTSNRVDRLPQKMKEFCRLQMGDVVLSLTGNVGRVGIVAEENCLLNQRVAVLRPFSKRNLPGLYFFFRQKSFQSAMIGIAKGTAQANLSPVETLQLSIPYEIEAFERLSDDLKPIFDSILANMVESRYLAELRDALLPKLIAGEIDVSEISSCSD